MQGSFSANLSNESTVDIYRNFYIRNGMLLASRNFVMVFGQHSTFSR